MIDLNDILAQKWQLVKRQKYGIMQYGNEIGNGNTTQLMNDVATMIGSINMHCDEVVDSALHQTTFPSNLLNSPLLTTSDICADNLCL